MARKIRQPGVDAAIQNAQATCASLASLDELTGEMRDQRRESWRQAADRGATYREIADSCGVSEALVKAELARSRGSAWMER